MPPGIPARGNRLGRPRLRYALTCRRKVSTSRRGGAHSRLNRTTELHRLEENLGRAGVRLTASDLEEIEQALAGIDIQGQRYSEGAQRLIDR